MNRYKIKTSRKLRVRRKVKNSSVKPRLTVFRSNKFIYAQIIDDANSKTIVSASDLKEKSAQKGSKVEKAAKVGEKIAIEAIKLKVTEVIFDRGEYKYHGRVKSLAEGARKGGLSF